MFTDFYFGNGKPGITTRVQGLEDRVEDFEVDMSKVEKTLEAHNHKIDRLSWLIAVGIGVLITLQFLLKH
jgi:hypothetical protein